MRASEADQRRTLSSDHSAGCQRWRQPAGQGRRSTAQDLSRGRRASGKTYGCADWRASAPREWTCGRVVERTAARRPRRLLDRAAGAAAQRTSIVKPHLTSSTRRCDVCGAEPVWSTSWRTHYSGSRPRQALPRARRVENGIDVYNHPKHPAHREPVRVVGPDHGRARARDGPDPHRLPPDAVELVDLTPDDLHKRLKEETVYHPQAGRGDAVSTTSRPPTSRACARFALRRTASA